jgi:hypothetical protein
LPSPQRTRSLRSIVCSPRRVCWTVSQPETHFGEFYSLNPSSEYAQTSSTVQLQVCIKHSRRLCELGRYSGCFTAVVTLARLVCLRKFLFHIFEMSGDSSGSSIICLFLLYITVFHSGIRPRGGGVGSGEGWMSPSPVWGMEQSPRKIFCHISPGGPNRSPGGLCPPPPGECLNETLLYNIHGCWQTVIVWVVSKLNFCRV